MRATQGSHLGETPKEVSYPSTRHFSSNTPHRRLHWQQVRWSIPCGRNHFYSIQSQSHHRFMPVP